MNEFDSKIHIRKTLKTEKVGHCHADTKARAFIDSVVEAYRDKPHSVVIFPLLYEHL